MKKISFLIVFLLVLTTASVSAVTLESINQDFLNLGFSIARETLPSINFTLKNLSDESVDLEDYRGKVVFLNFWATWCGPCKYEIPSMQELYDVYKDDGLEIVAVNLAERKSTVAKFVDEYEMTFPVLLDERSSVGSIYGARSIPTSYIIDRNGNILSMFVGAREWDTPEIYDLFEKVLEY